MTRRGWLILGGVVLAALALAGYAVYALTRIDFGGGR